MCHILFKISGSNACNIIGFNVNYQVLKFNHICFGYMYTRTPLYINYHLPFKYIYNIYSAICIHEFRKILKILVNFRWDLNCV